MSDITKKSPVSSNEERLAESGQGLLSHLDPKWVQALIEKVMERLSVVEPLESGLSDHDAAVMALWKPGNISLAEAHMLSEQEKELAMRAVAREIVIDAAKKVTQDHSGKTFSLHTIGQEIQNVINAELEEANELDAIEQEKDIEALLHREGPHIQMRAKEIFSSLKDKEKMQLQEKLKPMGGNPVQKIRLLCRGVAQNEVINNKKVAPKDSFTEVSTLLDWQIMQRHQSGGIPYAH